MWDEVAPPRRDKRGGSWLSPPRVQTVTARNWGTTDVAKNFDGFRLVSVNPNHSFEEEDLIMSEKLESWGPTQAALVKALFRIISMQEEELKRLGADIAVLRGRLADE